MKSAIALFTVLFGLSALAASDLTLIYTNGHLKGQVVSGTTYYGVYEMCSVGDAKSLSFRIWNTFKNDIEKDSLFARYDEAKKTVTWGYVDTKCLDEGMTPAECRSVHTIPPCR